MIINGAQIVLLQGAINSSALYRVGETWNYVAASLVALLISAGLIAFAFARGRGQRSPVRSKSPGAGGVGTVSSDERNSRDS
jgi:hypothetical protein